MSIKDKTSCMSLLGFAEEQAGREMRTPGNEPEPPYPPDFTAILKEHVADDVDAADVAGRTALAVAYSEFSV